MEKEEVAKVVADLFEATSEFLKLAISKSGLRVNTEQLNSLVSFSVNENKMKSLFLGEYTPATDENPEEEICLYIDSIVDYADYLGVDYWSVVAKVLFCQIHHYFTWQKKKALDFKKAEVFASRICRKLFRQKIVKDCRVKFYVDAHDKLTMVARQKWIEKWLGQGLEEIIKEVGIKAEDVPASQPTE